MKVSEKLNVSAEQFYDYLLYQVRKDIEQSTKKTHLTVAQLDGFRYRKQLKNKKGSPLTLVITVGPLIEHCYYELSYESPTAVNRYFYDIKVIDNQHIEVFYEEENRAKSVLNDWIYQARIKCKQKSLETKIRQTLLKIEFHILGQKQD